MENLKKDEIKQIIKEYLKENLRVYVEKGYSWGEEFIEVRLCLDDELLNTSET